ncbi:unnamed protein product [Ambrosiozyma monospora]|uniref:Unnamed protein product n=1 Tax=Ambrosiozyma monospora TaxID=43982 RepID=A0ACB5SSP3_AMBMO|nr:unnamed protein product [Ambrosiozyma monospora]
MATVIKPYAEDSYEDGLDDDIDADAVNEEPDLNDETFDDDFYQDNTIGMDSPGGLELPLEDIVEEEPSYDEHLYDSYLEGSPDSTAKLQKQKQQQQQQSRLPAPPVFALPSNLQTPSPTSSKNLNNDLDGDSSHLRAPIDMRIPEEPAREHTGHHQYRELVKQRQDPQLKPPVTEGHFTPSHSHSPPPKSILKSPHTHPVSSFPPIKSPLSTSRSDVNSEDESDEEFTDALQDLKRRSVGSSIHRTGTKASQNQSNEHITSTSSVPHTSQTNGRYPNSAGIPVIATTTASTAVPNSDSEKVTEELESSSSSTKVAPAAPTTQIKSSLRKASSKSSLLQPPQHSGASIRSNSLTSNTSSKKQVRIAAAPTGHRYSSSSSASSARLAVRQQAHHQLQTSGAKLTTAKPSDTEMYEMAFKVAMKNVYGDPQLEHELQNQEEDATLLEQEQALSLEEDTKRNTALNTGSVRTASLTSSIRRPGSMKQGLGRTLSMSSNVPRVAPSPNYHSNATGLGFATHSLRDMPDSKTIRKQKEKEAKEAAKEQERLRKEEERLRKEESKRLAKERKEAAKRLTSGGKLEAPASVSTEPATPNSKTRPPSHSVTSSNASVSTNGNADSTPNRRASRRLFGFKKSKKSKEKVNEPVIHAAIPTSGNYTPSAGVDVGSTPVIIENGQNGNHQAVNDQHHSLDPAQTSHPVAAAHGARGENSKTSPLKRLSSISRRSKKHDHVEQPIVGEEQHQKQQTDQVEAPPVLNFDQPFNPSGSPQQQQKQQQPATTEPQHSVQPVSHAHQRQPQEENTQPIASSSQPQSEPQQQTQLQTQSQQVQEPEQLPNKQASPEQHHDNHIQQQDQTQGSHNAKHDANKKTARRKFMEFFNL